MRLTVLGGSAASANAGQGCAGFLLDSGSTRIVLDLGPGVFPELRRHVDYRIVDGVVLSHYHLDHSLDLGAYVWALKHNPVAPPEKVPLWLPPGSADFIDRFGQLFSPKDPQDFIPSVFAPREFSDHQAFTIGDITLTPCPTVHFIPCWGFRCSVAGQGEFFYTADGGPGSRFGQEAMGAAVLLSEASYASVPAGKPKPQRHMSSEDAAKLATEIGALQLVLTHMYQEDDADQHLRQARQHFGGKIVIAKPGITVEWR